MPLLLEDLKTNKLYKKKVFLPTDEHNKRKNSVIMLMTPDYQSSVKTMNLPYFINTHRFESYYTEKNISFVLTESNTLYANPEEISIMENSISNYTRVNLDRLEELDEYDIPHENLEEPFTCQAYIHNTKCYGFIIMTANNTNIFRIEAYSYQMKKDLIQSALIFFNPKTVRLWNENDENLYKNYGFKRSKVLRDYYPMLIKEEAVPLLEDIGTAKIDLEIKLWQAQIKMTELIIHNHNDTNWMKHMYKDLKRKLNKIPLDDYVEDIDDSLDSLKRKLSDQKATLAFYTSVKSLEIKDNFDISDAINDYVDWIVKLSCPKALKIKILNQVISSYKLSIRECEYNLARYRKLDDTKKRMENGIALISKLTSAFSFITGGPLSIIKAKLVKAILPKTRRKNVLSEDELVAKIELYKSIVESLEKMKEESLSESAILTEAGKPSIPMDILAFNKELNKWPYGTLINGKIEKNPDYTKYKTLTIPQMDKYNVGVCWDFVHYEANWFKKNGYKFSTYFIMIDDNKNCPSHTFLIFYLPETNKYYYFESSWGKYRGIEEFNSENEAVKTVQKRHLDMYGKAEDKIYKTKYDAVSTSLENLTTIQYMDKMIKMLHESTILENIEYSPDQLYLASDNSEYDDELLSSADPNKNLSIGIIDAIKFAKKPSNKYYIYQPEDIDVSKYKSGADGRIQLDKDPTLRLMGKIEVKDDVNNYEWLWHYNNDGVKIYNWQESTLLENKLSAEDKKKLPNSDFGIPSERRYPMPDASHVKAAIRLFNHVEPEHEKELARNIKSKIKEFNLTDEINVSKDNRFSEYFKEEYNIRFKSIEDPIINGRIMQTEDTITFLEGNDEMLIEADAAYNAMLRRILYAERIKNQKEILTLYDTVKADCPWIKYAYVNYKRYANRNLFIDWSYYTKSFFENNYKKYDKAVDIYLDFLSRFLDDNRLIELGYNKKTVFIPVDDWIPNKNIDSFDYRKNLNPISIIRRLAFRDINKLKTMWGNCPFVFTGTHGFFIMDFSTFEKKNLPKFMQNVKMLVDNTPITDDDQDPDNSIGGIVNSVIDKLEDDSNGTIKINNLTGASKVKIEDIKNKERDLDPTLPENKDDTTEEKLVTAIAKTAATTNDSKDVMDKIDNDAYIKQLVIDLRTNTDDEVSINPARAARMRSLNDEFMKKQIANKKVGEIIAESSDYPLPETALPISTINDEWKHMKYINHSKEYNLDEDIMRCLHHFANVTLPVVVRGIDIENTSTSEDWIDTWTVSTEDSNGKRSTLKFDIPRLKNNRFMHLRGNDKNISGQLMNLPIIKTEGNTCQMTSNYNKIFFAGYGTSKGKSYVVADRIIKTLTKADKIKDIEISLGDNSRICSKYELPADYIDIASSISKIIYFNRHIGVKYTYFFNQDELLDKYGDIIKDKDSLTVGIMESNSFSGVKPIHTKGDVPISWQIYDMLSSSQEFKDIYDTTSTSVRYTYSKASILNTEIPIAVIIGYYVGLIPMLDKAGVKYIVSDKRPRYDRNLQDVIKLSDAFIVYDLNYDSSMLLNGLKECELEQYSLKEVNSKKMWLECLDIFGGRLKADGLDMFYDLMMDPITVGVCRKYMLPEDFVGGLLYANMLLSDNKYNKHSDISGNRYRTMELIAGYTYKAICNAYTQYRRELRAGRDAKLTMKQSAVIDLLFADNTFGDLSALTDLLEIESANSVSFRGLSGMNSDRAYGLDKRVFDNSMVNLLSLSTGFSANTGISRQSTIDMDIDSTRGYIKKTKTDDMSITKTFCMTEALTPMGTTSDDPFRSAMTFIQTAKHGMRVKQSDPLLVTNGAEQALPYMTSNTFTFKAAKSGKVKEKTDDYMVLGYNDNTTEVVDLRERILKNSDGGMYIALQLKTDLKEGNIFKSKEIVAYDDNSYSNDIGPHGNLSYDVGTFVKFAVMPSDEGFEDSCIETEWVSNAMSSIVVVNKEYTIPKDTNVYFIAKKGQEIQEGEPLLIFQNAFDEEDANMLIKALSDEDDDNIVAELGRIPIKSKVTGVVKDIKILRTVEIDELSPSLKKIVNGYEKDIKQFNKVLEQYDKDKAKTTDATYKLEPTGKLKNAKDSVRIEFSLAYEDKFSVGDKAVCYSAMKGVSKGIIPLGDEPTSSFRPDEKLHYIQTINGELKRMVGSVLKVGALNKVMVELARSSCDIMGIKWKYFDEY